MMALSEIRRMPTVLLLMTVAITHAASAEDAEDAATKLAKQTQNPVASLISVPFELNYNGEFGPNNGDQAVLNIKPVVPVRISENWNLINRAIMPLISQPGLPGGPNRKNGLGDTVYQAFLSPAEPGKIIWGAGPQIQIPTHTDEVLGNEHWGAGPAAVVLTMPGNWVLGMLAAQMWDVASSGNDGSEADISQTTVQPFVNYNFGGGWYASTAPVITANWRADNDDEWTVPVGGGVGRVFRMGKQNVNMKMAYYYNVTKPDFGAQWDMQLTFFLLFPK